MKITIKEEGHNSQVLIYILYLTREKYAFWLIVMIMNMFLHDMITICIYCYILI